MALDNTSLNVLLLILLVVFFWIFIIWQNTRKMHRQIHQVAHQQSVIRHDDRARELCRAIHYLQPNVHAGVDYLIKDDTPGNTPYIAEWHANAPQPTGEQIQAALEKVSVTAAGADYATLRRAEYPGVTDQLEAAYKARQGDASMQDELDAKITEIREKYPKADECL